MKKEESNLLRYESLTDAHRAFGLPNPKHPLITIVNGRQMMVTLPETRKPHVLNFYKISYKPKLSGRIKYGQGHYDFDEGGLLFAAPNQTIGASDDHDLAACSDFAVLIHPDFLLGYPLAKNIRQFGFFSYSTNEGLHLSDEERSVVLSVFKMIENELNSRIDDFSHDVIISQLELLLNFANRFYKRQFITRKAASHDLLSRLETILDNHFDDTPQSTHGLPTVTYLADQVNVSASYLSDMLRSLIGQNTQQFIHSRLIDKAKEKLSTTSLSVSEVAFALGFEHPQSFSKLFKTKTNLSPLEFRRSFN